MSEIDINQVIWWSMGIIAVFAVLLTIGFRQLAALEALARECSFCSVAAGIGPGSIRRIRICAQISNGGAEYVHFMANTIPWVNLGPAKQQEVLKYWMKYSYPKQKLISFTTFFSGESPVTTT